MQVCMSLQVVRAQACNATLYTVLLAVLPCLTCLRCWRSACARAAGHLPPTLSQDVCGTLGE